MIDLDHLARLGLTIWPTTDGRFQASIRTDQSGQAFRVAFGATPSEAVDAAAATILPPPAPPPGALPPPPY